MKRLRFPIPLSILLFLALTAVGAYYVRKGMLERAMANALTIGDEAMIRSLLDSWPCPIRARVKDGMEGFDKPITGSTALHWSVRRGDAQLVRTCLDRGADANARDTTGWTTLHYAAAWGTAEIVQALVDHAADVNDNEAALDTIAGLTPLLIAADGVKPEIVQALLDRGADVNAKDSGGYSPLHWVRSADIARLLIDHGVDVNAKDSGGDTPLHNVRFADVARVLIDRGADVNAKDDNGLTPLTMAGAWNPRDDNQSAEKQRILRVLRDAGATE